MTKDRNFKWIDLFLFASNKQTNTFKFWRNINSNIFSIYQPDFSLHKQDFLFWLIDDAGESTV